MRAESGGRPFRHPLIEAISDAEKTPAALGAALGLDPAGRRALGCPIGVSQSPDRQPRGRLVALTVRLSRDG